MTISVNGNQCAPNSYPNKPCVTVTVCTPGSTSQCRTVNDILLDTGSVGLRIFKQALTGLPTNPVTGAGGSKITECVGYGDGSAHWGTVEKVDMILGGEPTLSNVSIQVVDSTVGTPPSHCAKAETGPSEAGMNGILGLGLSQYDCGHDCVTSVGNGQYFSCSGSTCNPSAVSLANQLQNPVGRMPVDNNGVILSFPDIEDAGVLNMEGYLIFGIGTRDNNVPPADIHSLAASTYHEIATQFNGRTFPAFIDSGSNSYAIPNPGIPTCYGGWFCPSSILGLTATNVAYDGSSAYTSAFAIASFDTFIRSPFYASKEIGVSVGGLLSGFFDWGFPFYVGRNIYHGIEGKSSSIGIGRYWAY